MCVCLCGPDINMPFEKKCSHFSHLLVESFQFLNADNINNSMSGISVMVFFFFLSVGPRWDYCDFNEDFLLNEMHLQLLLLLARRSFLIGGDEDASHQSSLSPLLLAVTA